MHETNTMMERGGRFEEPKRNEAKQNKTKEKNHVLSRLPFKID